MNSDLASFLMIYVYWICNFALLFLFELNVYVSDMRVELQFNDLSKTMVWIFESIIRHIYLTQVSLAINSVNTVWLLLANYVSIISDPQTCQSLSSLGFPQIGEEWVSSNENSLFIKINGILLLFVTPIKSILFVYIHKIPTWVHCKHIAGCI